MSRVAGRRRLPVMTLSAFTRIGDCIAYAAMLPAIWATCASEWILAYLLKGTNLSMVQYSMCLAIG